MTRVLLALMMVAIPPLLFGLRTGAYVSGALVILCLIRAVVLVVARRVEKERRLRVGTSHQTDAASSAVDARRQSERVGQPTARRSSIVRHFFHHR